MTTGSAIDVHAAGTLRQGRNGNPFGKMFLWLALHPAVDAPAAAIHGLLCSLARDDGETTMPSMEQIGKAFNIKSRTTVRKYLQQLRDAGGLDYHQRRTADNWKTRNIYTVHFDPPEDFEGFRTWKRWREHHFPKPARPADVEGKTPGSGNGQTLTDHGHEILDHEQESHHITRAHDVETTSSDGVCVDDSAAAAGTFPTSGADTDRVAAIRAVVRGVYSAPQRARLTKPEEVAEIRAVTGALLDRGWTVDALVAQLRQRVTWNSRTVAFGKNLIRALKDMGPLEPNSAVVDEFADPDEPSGDDDDRPGSAAPVPYDAPFLAFWAAYPRRRDKQAAWDKWTQRIAEGVDAEVIIAGAARYRAERDGEDPKFTKHPKTWLHNHCWQDEPERPARTGLPVRESLSARRNREIDEAVAAVAAELAGQPFTDTGPGWDGTVIDTDGRPT
ncbi:hypothetical protein LO763_22235 [Glycomyces sp. A-F 0318]|uniref:hypothetical protein n=1 Tax=Glycomyces amatae TaxID=2881355 RepID=UPI001E42DF3C|nr:hypothetical protein [Glycomyces amatae]MCD0446337.1 hypothetical protein [Glycomyces amatae]